MPTNGALYKLFEACYVPMLLNKWVRPAVMVVFFGWLCSSLAVIPHIDVGLDQEQSVPADSPVQKYFSVCDGSEPLSVTERSIFQLLYKFYYIFAVPEELLIRWTTSILCGY